MIGFIPYASLAGRGEKRCEIRELLSRAGGCVGSTYFSGAEDLSNSVDDYAKGCHTRIECRMRMAC
jgi:hypothetical protein